MGRIPASGLTREKLKTLMEGTSAGGELGSELVRLAARLILEEALEGEAEDALGRGYYMRGALPGEGSRSPSEMAEHQAECVDVDRTLHPHTSPAELNLDHPWLSRGLLERRQRCRCRGDVVTAANRNERCRSLIRWRGTHRLPPPGLQ